MSIGHPHVGDVHRLRVISPVAFVGPVTLRLQKPDGTTIDVDATIDPAISTNTQIYYDTTTSDLDQVGEWQIQVRDGSGPWRTDVGRFLVLANLGTDGF